MSLSSSSYSTLSKMSMSVNIPRTGRLCTRCSKKSTLGVSSGRRALTSPSPTTSPMPSHHPCMPCPPRRHFSTTKLVRARTPVDNGNKRRKVDMEDFPRERIRNLSIIAHIDHGKSTLADRLLQMTGTLPASSNPQFLDKLKVERERGITVKAQTVSIIHRHTDGEEYLINLIDTPGHVDFSYEVSRSLGACEGGLLLVDCSQGIQAQTLSVFHHALEADLKLLAVINKVDLPHASPDETAEQIATSLGLEKKDHMRISAKSGLGVDTVLNSIIDGLPSPKEWESGDGKLRGLIFDTHYDQFRGVVSLVRVFSGSIKRGDKIRFLQAGKKYDVLEIGINNPEEIPVDILKEGQVGYLVCNMKNSDEAFIGDTVCLADQPVDPLPGFQPMKAMVFAGVFPVDTGDFNKLEEAIERLTLNDRSVSIQRESSAALSQGFRLGFLGTLHMDVFRQRLEDEYSSEVIITAPTVPYRVKLSKGKEVIISNPSEFPDVSGMQNRLGSIAEPIVNATIIVPTEYIGAMMDLCARYRGVQQEYKVMETTQRAILKYQLPLGEIVTDFFSELKSSSSGFASFDYEEAGYETADLVKVHIALNGKPVDALAVIVHRSAAATTGRAWCKKLKEVVPKQLFELSIQAVVGAKVIARESLSAMRKDVTAGLYGGHYERKLKHLNRQKEGKKRLKRLAGNIDVSQSAFFQVLSARSRAYSTPAELKFDVENDPIQPPSTLSKRIMEDKIVLPFIPPGLVIPELPTALQTPISPIPRHTVSPEYRSSRLSTLYRLTTLPPRHIDPELLWSTYQDLLSSSPDSHILTPHEIRAVLRAIHTYDRAYDTHTNTERLGSTFEELRNVVGSDTPEVTELISMIIHSSRRGRVVDEDLREAEKTMTWLFDAKSQERATWSEGLKLRYRSSINKILHLAAQVPDGKKFEVWWERLDVRDTWAWMARLVKSKETGKIHDIPGVLERAMLDTVEGDPGRLVLVNYAMMQYAKKARWDIVAPAYREIRNRYSEVDKDIPLPPPLDTQCLTFGAFLTIPNDIKPDRATFQILLFVFVRQGHLAAALTVFSDMFNMDCEPHVEEYLILFKGFTLFGVIPPNASGSGQVGGLFPLMERSEPGKVGDVGGINRIWSRGIGMVGDEKGEGKGVGVGVGVGKGLSGTGNTTSNPWTREMLQELIESFLTLRPGVGSGYDMGRNMRAPDATGVWTLMFAISRVSGGDAKTVWGVWEVVRRKFEEQEDVVAEEGEESRWTGWKVDKRLEELVAGLEDVLAGRERVRKEVEVPINNRDVEVVSRGALRREGVDRIRPPRRAGADMSIDEEPTADLAGSIPRLQGGEERRGRRVGWGDRK